MAPIEYSKWGKGSFLGELKLQDTILSPTGVRTTIQADWIKYKHTGTHILSSTYATQSHWTE